MAVNPIIILNRKTNLNELFIPHDKTTAFKGYRGLNFFGKIKFSYILAVCYFKLTIFHLCALILKRAAVGPFWGEFGNFHLHYYPYVAYLHKKGVKMTVCVSNNFQPFLKTADGIELYEEIVQLGNTVGKVKVSGNILKEATPDVYEKYNEFLALSSRKNTPLLDLTNGNLYWYVFRNWELNGRQHIYQKIEEKESTEKPFVVLFPRNKSGAFTVNNGFAWDYMELAKTISSFCEKVVITGHPSMSATCYEQGNILLQLSEDNQDVMKAVEQSDLIITQHSGAMHIANYYYKPTCLIFKGPLPVKGLDDSIRFRENLKGNTLYFAQNEEEIVALLNTFKNGKFREA